jgi:photoactive yellow protein
MDHLTPTTHPQTIHPSLAQRASSADGAFATSAPDLVALVDTQRARLVTGTFALDTSGRIVFYNQAEGLLSPRRAKELLGKHFFHDLSPYQLVPGLYRAFQDGVANRSLSRRFSLLAPNGTRQRLSLLYSSANNLVWARVDLLP